jgi:Response regulator containing a CheY-like receiver domain and an HTH DNA-binding domain
VARILIADDRESMRTAVKSVFVMRPNWEVCGEAEDGDEAVAKAVQLQPDLLLMDFRMHQSDGLKAAAEIKRTMPSLPIVMYTLYKTVELEAAAQRVGVRFVVAKEDGVQMLLRAIDTELQASGAASTPSV